MYLFAVVITVCLLIPTKHWMSDVSLLRGSGQYTVKFLWPVGDVRAHMTLAIRDVALNEKHERS